MRFNADICSGDAHWVLPPELWPESAGIQRELLRQNGGDLGVVVRILATDEGSPILKTFFFLAGHCKLRVFVIRDPPHRLSNLFNAGLRGVTSVLTTVFDILLLHKFRGPRTALVASGDR